MLLVFSLFKFIHLTFYGAQVVSGGVRLCTIQTASGLVEEAEPVEVTGVTQGNTPARVGPGLSPPSLQAL